jgi:hypothetical protein
MMQWSDAELRLDFISKIRNFVFCEFLVLSLFPRVWRIAPSTGEIAALQSNKQGRNAYAGSFTLD